MVGNLDIKVHLTRANTQQSMCTDKHPIQNEMRHYVTYNAKDNPERSSGAPEEEG